MHSFKGFLMGALVFGVVMGSVVCEAKPLSGPIRLPNPVSQARQEPQPPYGPPRVLCVVPAVAWTVAPVAVCPVTWCAPVLPVVPMVWAAPVYACPLVPVWPVPVSFVFP